MNGWRAYADAAFMQTSHFQQAPFLSETYSIGPYDLIIQNCYFAGRVLSGNTNSPALVLSLLVNGTTQVCVTHIVEFFTPGVSFGMRCTDYRTRSQGVRLPAGGVFQVRSQQTFQGPDLILFWRICCTVAPYAPMRAYAYDNLMQGFEP